MLINRTSSNPSGRLSAGHRAAAAAGVASPRPTRPARARRQPHAARYAAAHGAHPWRRPLPPLGPPRPSHEAAQARQARPRRQPPPPACCRPGTPPPPPDSPKPTKRGRPRSPHRHTHRQHATHFAASPRTCSTRSSGRRTGWLIGMWCPACVATSPWRCLWGPTARASHGTVACLRRATAWRQRWCPPPRIGRYCTILRVVQCTSGTHVRQKSFKVIEGGQRVQFGMWWAKHAQGDEVCWSTSVCGSLTLHNAGPGNLGRMMMPACTTAEAAFIVVV